MLFLGIEFGLSVTPHYICAGGNHGTFLHDSWGKIKTLCDLSTFGTIGYPERNYCAHVEFGIYANFIFAILL